ncbi:hypothetical protein L917_03651 [Phytophthora nicotianae]|uniref:Uncharacterized protein n=1 Tax=Phytophthora nicotianae TaxID=4792 RepID=W2HCT9_PHYNI|nr:hypothetical protein L915_03799 [Phytophthora nicotianae]ETL99516.1 hypothetical protein L917_03651 [Phytophthora nicotianae]
MYRKRLRQMVTERSWISKLLVKPARIQDTR